MGDLEDRILRQNVPGRWSSLDDRSDVRMDTEEGENDEGHHRSDDKAVRSTRAKARERYISRRGEESSEGDVEDEDVNEQGAGTNEALSYAAMMADEDIPEDVKMQILMERGGKAATGIKGVLADKAAADRLRAARTVHRAQKREQDLLRIARGSIHPGSSNAGQLMHANVGDEAALSDEDDFDIDDESDDDDDFMRSYREARLRELQRHTGVSVSSAASVQPAQSALGSGGKVVHLGTPQDLLQELERGCVSVVLIFGDGNVAATSMFLSAFAQLARCWGSHPRYSGFRFSQIQHNKAGLLDLDASTLPALAVFDRSGDVVSVIAGIEQELRGELSESGSGGESVRFSRHTPESLSTELQWLLESSEGWSSL